ncbi:P-loop containing nucleoside triphosphate hydrolase protein [Mycena galopus ATCC 62051]|nr:P-loop containing nucleoside triphosphate hydrolase protein [Mycena galopus ATCC 62051]
MHIQQIKCVVVGDGGAGKTSLFISYATNKFPTEYLPTVYDNQVLVTIRERCYQLWLWDTTAKDEYDRLRPLAYPQTDVFLICFSVASPDSFTNIRDKWFPEVYYHCPSTPCLIVGTQIDLRDDSNVIDRLASQNQRPVTECQGERLVQELGAAKYVECSALTQRGLTDIFEEAVLTTLIPRRKADKPWLLAGAV